MTISTFQKPLLVKLSIGGRLDDPKPPTDAKGENAPGTIWVEGAVTGRVWEYEKSECLSPHEYRRADLPATDAQALVNPKVKALLEALNDAIGDATWGIDHETYKKGRAALAALEAKP